MDSRLMIVFIGAPILLWIVSLVLMQKARKEQGFNLFFRHFSLIGLEGFVCYFLYKIFPISGGYKAFLGFVGAHTVFLLLHAVFIYGKKAYNDRILKTKSSKDNEVESEQIEALPQ